MYDCTLDDAPDVDILACAGDSTDILGVSGAIGSYGIRDGVLEGNYIAHSVYAKMEGSSQISWTHENTSEFSHGPPARQFAFLQVTQYNAQNAGLHDSIVVRIAMANLDDHSGKTLSFIKPTTFRSSSPLTEDDISLDNAARGGDPPGRARVVFATQIPSMAFGMDYEQNDLVGICDGHVHGAIRLVVFDLSIS